MESLLSPLLISLQVSFATLLLVYPPALLLGLLLSRRTFPGKSVVETVSALPLVLPPTAIGYLLLVSLARDGPLGVKALGVDLDLLLTWKGATIAAAVMAFPLVTRAARVAFEGVDPRLEGMARTLGYGPLRTFARVTLPLARRGLLAAAILGFSRALGEFGATVIVAGNIPGRTQTLALAIYADLQSGHDRRAMALVALTTGLAFAAVWIVEGLLRQTPRRA